MSLGLPLGILLGLTHVRVLRMGGWSLWLQEAGLKSTGVDAHIAGFMITISTIWTDTLGATFVSIVLALILAFITIPTFLAAGPRRTWTCFATGIVVLGTAILWVLPILPPILR